MSSSLFNMHLFATSWVMVVSIGIPIRTGNRESTVGNIANSAWSLLSCLLSPIRSVPREKKDIGLHYTKT